MTKRKGELRTGTFPLTAHRYTSLKTIRQGSEEQWNISNIQPFYPPIEKLFKTTLLENAHEYGLRFNQEVTQIVSPTEVKLSTGETVRVYRKTSMLLSPFKWMQGDYGQTLGLPATEDESNLVFAKLQNPNNSSYVGSILSSILSQSGCQHFVKVHGTFTGFSKKHTINISDDYEDLCERSWFSQNIGKLFEIKLSDAVQSSSEFRHTRSARVSIQLGEESESLGPIKQLDGIETEVTAAGELNKVFADAEDDIDTESDSSSVSTSYIFAVHSCDCDSDSESDTDTEMSSVEPYAWVTFTNVPVQVTVMEECQGTLFQLFMQNPDTEKHLAWITQVLFALAYAQRNFGFVHNDLHANNVMYVATTEEYFYYNCGGVLYKVPTFGYLIKLIDFERSLMSVKLQGMKEPKFFMSDHFSIDEEAGGQYNCEPFYIQSQPTIKPNPSFDLVRLAISIFWDLFPEGPECAEYSENLLFQMFMRWLTLEDKTSVLFGKKDAKHDRYHDFNLYKAITRYCKDTAIPRREIELLKEKYQTDSIPSGSTSLFIDY